MTVNEYIEMSGKYNQMVDNAEKKLKEITKENLTEIGTINDETKKSIEYRKAKHAFDNAFNLLRKFNGSVSNKTKREARKIRRGY